MCMVDAVASPLADQLARLKSPRSLRFPLAALPLSELLLTAHISRFTGCMAIRAGGHMPAPDFATAPGRRTTLAAGTDLLFFREGSLVGLERVGRPGANGLVRVLLERGALDSAEAEAFGGVAKEGLELCRLLERRGLVSRSELDIGVAEHARRRLFERVADDRSIVDARAGVEALAHFHPVYIDPRPAIAYGFVSHGRAAEKRAQMNRASRRRARLLVPYDAERNAYGLPRPILRALKDLEYGGVVFGEQPGFPYLSENDTAGLLVLMDRIGLLEVEDAHLRYSSSRPSEREGSSEGLR